MIMILVTILYVMRLIIAIISMRRIVISPDKYEPSSRCDRWHVAVVFTSAVTSDV